MIIRHRLYGVLLFKLLWLVRPAFAQSSALQLGLHLIDCPSLDDDAVQTLLGIEMAAAQIHEADINVTAACDDQIVTAKVTDNVVGELQRTISWQGVQSIARSRLFSLAVAEMISSARREHEETLRQQVANRQRVLANPAIVDSAERPLQNAAAVEFSIPTINAFAGVSRLGAGWSLAPTVGMGITRPWQGHDSISFQMDLAVTQAWSEFQRGDAAFTSFGASPRIQFHTQPARYVGFVHCGTSLAFATISGSSNDPAIEAQRRSATLWGATTGIGVAVNGKMLQIGTSLSATWLTRPLHVRTVSGNFVAQDNALARIVPTLNVSIGWP